jgi:predicted RNA methylase
MGQIKQGFYPFAPEGVRLWAGHLDIEDPGRIAILDPCCGRGEAASVLAQALSVPARGVYAMELDAGRAEDARGLLEGGTVVGPADFLNARISGQAFDIVWLNPPFDDELGGGGREETAFLSRAIGVIVPGGVLGLVIPEDQLSWKIRRIMSEHFRHIRVFVPPDELRPFREIIVTATRLGPKDDWDMTDMDTTYPLDSQDPDLIWRVAARKRRRPVFAKGGPTEHEILAMFGESPANRLFEPAVPMQPPRPILPLSTGHSSLVVASGQVDGVIRPPNEPPHVVRGTTKKEKVVANVEVGEHSTTTTFTEKMVPMVRTIGPDGVIRTFV